MNVLVTAGNTQAPLDRVRCVTNIFTGRTGGQIAAAAAGRGHAVTLLTSHPEAVAPPAAGWRVRPYRTFDDLAGLMAAEVSGGGYDAVVHSAAVSDYLVAGVFARGPAGEHADAAAGKVRSTHPELWVKMTPAPKLVDRVRTDWRFRGVLVKFKLEVGPGEAELLDLAERSRAHSGADLMCANTLEGMHDWAALGAGPGGYERVRRAELAARLVAAVERLHGGRA
jgi:phosphopantothenoylcysteine synthetase/decarboxylase